MSAKGTTSLAIGKQVGWGLLVSFTPGAHGVKARYGLQCIACGVIHEGQGEILARSRMQHHAGKTCPSCTVKVKRQPKICPSCYGMAHVRPATGCRRCGQPYAPEVIRKSADDRNGWEAWTW